MINEIVHAGAGVIGKVIIEIEPAKTERDFIARPNRREGILDDRVKRQEPEHNSKAFYHTSWASLRPKD